MKTKSLSLDAIYSLAYKCLTLNGADEENTKILSETIVNAERDGSISHGLFRLPGYIASLRSGKVNGKARPRIKNITSTVIGIDGDNGYAPMAHSVGLPALINAAKINGVSILAISNTHHFAALWPEVEAIAEESLVGMACTSYLPVVAPAGAKKPLFGTNPIAFSWPRPGSRPVVFDMATASMAMGEVQVAARDGHKVPIGTGLDKEGNYTEDPNDIVNGGVLLPFGGYKGSAISLMVELLAGGLINQNFSYESKEKDNKDGGPPTGGQFIIALSPAIISGNNWENHCNEFFQRFSELGTARLPGVRRHKNRLSLSPRTIDKGLLKKIYDLM